MVEGKTNQEKTEKSVDINLPQKISDINELGYPVNDPYGLVAAFWNEEAPMTVFGNMS